MINYTNFMSHKPFSFTKMVNSKGQIIELYEHPTLGDNAPIVAVSHDLQLAQYTGFFDYEDMTADHKEYEPTFEDGKLLIGGMSI